MFKVDLKCFDAPDEVRVFEKGKFELLRLGEMTIGRATYEPGWRWSEHVGRALGKQSCDVENVGMVIAGCATAAMNDGTVKEMRAGDLFYIATGMTVGSWVKNRMSRCIFSVHRPMPSTGEVFGAGATTP
jgi:hypothetical protein